MSGHGAKTLLHAVSCLPRGLSTLRRTISPSCNRRPKLPPPTLSPQQTAEASPERSAFVKSPRQASPERSAFLKSTRQASPECSAFVKSTRQASPERSAFQGAAPTPRESTTPSRNGLPSDQGLIGADLRPAGVETGVRRRMRACERHV